MHRWSLRIEWPYALGFTLQMLSHMSCLLEHLLIIKDAHYAHNKHSRELMKYLLIALAAWEENPNFSVKKTLKYREREISTLENYSVFNN